MCALDTQSETPHSLISQDKQEQCCGVVLLKYMLTQHTYCAARRPTLARSCPVRYNSISLSVYSVTVFRTALAFEPSVPLRVCRNTHEGPLSFIGPRLFLALFPVTTHPIPPTGHSFEWVHLFVLLMQVRLCFSSVPTVLWSHKTIKWCIEQMGCVSC